LPKKNSRDPDLQRALRKLQASFERLRAEIQPLIQSIQEPLNQLARRLQKFQDSLHQIKFPADFADLLQHFDDLAWLSYPEKRQWPDFIKQRDAAVRRLASRMKLSLKNPEARRSLQRLAKAWGISSRTLLVEHFFPTALLLVLDKTFSTEKPVMRIGKDWLKDKVLPPNLPLNAFRAWAFQEAYKNASESVLDALFETIGKTRDAVAASPEDLRIEKEMIRTTKARAASLKLAATRKQSEVLKLAEQGMQDSEIIDKLRITPEYLRQLKSRLRKKDKKF
jgi:DNA-binding CsgD family transcriptional regulator